MLKKNAFYILGLTPRDGKDAIAEAFEEGLSRHDYEEGDLLQAQKSLMASKARLDAEISWFPDLSPKKSQYIVATFVSDKIAIDNNFEITLDKTLDELSGVSKANLAAFVCHRKIANFKTLKVLVECQQDISIESLKSLINANRKISGFPEVNDDLLSEQLLKKKRFWAEAAIEQISQFDHPGNCMTDLVNDFKDSDLTIRRFLEEILECYEAWAIPSLRNHEDEINKCIASIRETNEGRERSVDNIIESLRQWDEYAQPSQIISSSKGLDEPRSKKIFDLVRDLGLWLANEQSEYKLSLKLSQASKEIFAELPSVSNKLDEDIGTLTGLIDQAKAWADVAPLAELIDKLTKKDLPLVEQFNSQKRTSDEKFWRSGLAGELYELFLDACRKSQGSDHSSSPWFLMRNLALHLNNEGDSPEAAKRLIEKITSLDPPADIQILLAKDLRTMRGNCLVRDLKRLGSNNRKKAMEIVEEIISIADEEDKQGWRDALNKLKGQQNAARAKFIVWGVIIAGIYGLTQCDDKGTSSHRNSSNSYHASSSNYTPPARQYDDKSEVPPPPNAAGTTVSVKGLRWCEYEKKRLDYISDQLPASEADNDATAKYNYGLVTKQIADTYDAWIRNYNSRCVNVQFYTADETTIKSELSNSTIISNLNDEARKRMLSWNQNFLFKDQP